MSIPRDHHYLPRFYLDRWATNGKVVRYLRPRGANGPLSIKSKPVSAIAYQRDLYHLPDIDDDRNSQSLELDFFQRIDDRAAVALRKLDAGERGSFADRVALSQFMISLMHRSPSRLENIRQELAQNTEGAPYETASGEHYEKLIKATANRLLATLVESPEGARVVGRFKVFATSLQGGQTKLLTADRPVTISAQLIAPDAFMILPYAPDRLAILAHDQRVAKSFADQDPDVLANGINRAVVEQSQDIIVAADRTETKMIESLFMRPSQDVVFDSIGFIRRRSPFVDLMPQVRKFSAKRKRDMLYLGRD